MSRKIGIGLSVLISLPFIMSVFMIFTMNPQVVEGMAKYGFPQGTIIPMGIIELACVILYALPTTSVLGAILLTGWLGGAVCTHLRASEIPNSVIPVVFGIVIWAGLWLRDPRLKALIPLRR